MLIQSPAAVSSEGRQPVPQKLSSVSPPPPAFSPGWVSLAQGGYKWLPGSGNKHWHCDLCYFKLQNTK